MIIFSHPNVDHRSYMGVPIDTRFANELVDCQFAHHLAITAVLAVLADTSAIGTVSASFRNMVTAPGVLRKMGNGVLFALNGIGAYLVLDYSLEAVSQCKTEREFLRTLIQEYSYTTNDQNGHPITVVNTWMDRSGLRLLNTRLTRHGLPPMKWQT